MSAYAIHDLAIQLNAAEARIEHLERRVSLLLTRLDHPGSLTDAEQAELSAHLERHPRWPDAATIDMEGE